MRHHFSSQNFFLAQKRAFRQSRCIASPKRNSCPQTTMRHVPPPHTALPLNRMLEHILSYLYICHFAHPFVSPPSLPHISLSIPIFSPLQSICFKKPQVFHQFRVKSAPLKHRAIGAPAKTRYSGHKRSPLCAMWTHSNLPDPFSYSMKERQKNW